MAHAAAHSRKMFVVGDGKQAIYRFRGADMGVTQMVKDGDNSSHCRSARTAAPRRRFLTG